ncbi:MAG: hypothetical protein HC848_00195 [Limnobacter sp.]|nr:hypothetical protein [Limnobacter sp.]
MRKKAVDMAKALGCSHVGLGGYTSIVAQSGLALHHSDINITTGNALTAGASLMSTLEVAKTKHTGPKTIGVIGAGGNVAATLCKLLADMLGPEDELILFSRNAQGAKHLEDFAKQLTCRVSVEPELTNLQRCNLIFSASNASNPLIFEHHIQSENTIVCDIAVPPDVARCAQEKAHVLRGGRIKLPHNQSLGLLAGTDTQAHIFACMAETILLGLENRTGHFSYGAIEPDKVKEILQLADKHGFEIQSSQNLSVFQINYPESKKYECV